MDVRSLQDKYGGIGYIFAEVKADPRLLEVPAQFERTPMHNPYGIADVITPLIVTPVQLTQLDLIYHIKEGDRYRVGKINITVERVDPRTQVKSFSLGFQSKPGDIVDIRKIREDERRLQTWGWFGQRTPQRRQKSPSARCRPLGRSRRIARST